VALVAKYLGGEYDLQQRHTDARVANERALALDERRLALAPADMRVQMDVSNDLSQLGVLQSDEGHYDDADALLARALRFRRAIADADPKDVLAMEKIGSIEWRIAANARRAGRWSDAAASANRAAATMARILPHNRDLVTLRDNAASLLEVALAHLHAGRRSAACDSARRAQGFVDDITKLGAQPVWDTVVRELPPLVSKCRGR
jgi:tetratricopeptide (TPR) repeat protein